MVTRSRESRTCRIFLYLRNCCQQKAQRTMIAEAGYFSQFVRQT